VDRAAANGIAPKLAVMLNAPATSAVSTYLSRNDKVLPVRLAQPER
jgi:hypothetical protein